MSDSSRSDEIGRIGESWFDLLANKARLLAGRIEPDRLGRDRVLEFPAKARIETEPFDIRHPPLGCSIQIKSILAPNDRVALTLSVAERLAGDNRPAFICILRIDENDEIVDMHLVHLLGDNLARILKRLREEFARGTEALNKTQITFGIAAGRKVDLTPDDLKDALRELIGEDMNAYAAEKLRQRETAGFKEGERYSMSVLFEEMPSSDLIDGMLGLKKLAIKNLQPFEERFDIKLPGGLPFPSGFESAVLEISPIPVDAGVISISCSARGLPVELNCDLIAPAFPQIPVERMKIIARAKLLDAFVSIGEGSIRLSNTFDELSTHHFDDWWKLFNFWDAVFTDGAKLSLRTDGGLALFSGSLGDAATTGEGAEYVRDVLAILEMARRLLEEADSLDRPVSLRDVMRSAKSIKQTHDFFFRANELGSFSFKVDKAEHVEAGEYPGLFVFAFQLGDDLYAYALKLTLILADVEGDLEFRSTSMAPLDIAWIANEESALQKFVQRTAKLSGSRIIIRPTFKNLEQPTGSPE